MKLETRSWRVHPIYPLIVIAIILRMVIWPTGPVLWGDEALTYSRVCGTFRDMLDVLQRDGFVPLHYELYWLIGHFVRLDPVVMRIVPELSGVAMVPAMYFLARQFLGRKTAILVATFTVASAYMNDYSRDAKMYPDFWLFCVLSTACYLWWIKCWQTRGIGGIAWLCWIATSLAMVGLHAPGMILLSLPLVILVTQRWPHWKQVVLTLGGLAIIVAGPGGYYWKFNTLSERSEERSFESASGVFWVKGYNEGRTGPDHLLYTASAFLLSWEWPRPRDMKASDPADVEQWNREMVYGIPRGYAHTLEFFTAGLLGLAAIGALPWPRRWRGEDTEPPDAPARPWWRCLLWLGFWLVVPVYAFYCLSVPGFESPMVWLHNRTLQLAAALGLALWLAYPVDNSFRDRVKAAVQFIFVAAGILGCCLAINNEIPDQPAASIWIPRYLGIVWPAFAIGLCALFMRLPTRPLRWGAIAMLLGINLFKTTARLVQDTEPPVDRMAQDVVDSDAGRRQMIGDRLVVWRPHHPDQPLTRTYIERFRTDIPHPGHGSIFLMNGRYYLTILENWDLNPSQFRSMMPNSYNNYFYDIPDASDPEWVARNANANSQLARVVVWDRIAPDQPGSNSLDSLLGSKWRRVSEDDFPTRMHWLWQELATYRRREYVRTDHP